MEKDIYTILDSLDKDEIDTLLSKDLDFKMPSTSYKKINKLVINKMNNKNPNKLIGGLTMKRTALFLSVLLFIVLTLGFTIKSYANKATSYVAIDINPSIEIGLNNFNKVVSLKAYNDDGEYVINNIDFKHLSFEETLSKVIDESIKGGYIKDEKSSEISITTLTKNGEVNKDVEDLINNTINGVLENAHIKVNILSTNLPLERKAEAEALGISPGKLNLIQKLQELDPTIKVEDYKDLSVKEIQKAKKELKKDEAKDETPSKNEDKQPTANPSDNKNNSGNENKSPNASDKKEDPKSNNSNKVDEDKKPNSDKTNNKKPKTP